MADQTKNINIKLSGDTTDIDNKLTKTVQLSMQFGIALEQAAQRVDLLAAKEANLSKLQTTIGKLDDSLSSGRLSEALAFGAARASLISYNNELNKIQTNLTSTLSLTERMSRDSGIPKLSSAYKGDISSGMTLAGNNAIAASQKEISKAIDESNSKLKETEGHHKNILIHVGEIILSYRALNAAINLGQQALLNIPKAGIQQQATQASVFAIFGTEQGTKNLAYLRELADIAGQTITSLETAYRSFAPSATLAGASQGEVNKIFKNFTEVGTVLHFPEDKLKSLYLALEQMYAKTTVQSEEIKKQLGNVLPGAVEIGAKAWAKMNNQAEVSVASFMDAMKKNLVVTKQFAPIFAEEYKKIFGGVDDSVFNDTRTKLLSNLNRIQNEYTYFSRELFSITEGTMNDAVKLGISLLTSLKENLQAISQVIEGLLILMSVRAAQAIAVLTFGKTVKEIEGVAVAVSNLSLALDFLKTKGAFLGTIFNPLVLGITAGTAALLGLTAAASDADIKFGKFSGSSKEEINSLMAAYAAGGEGADVAATKLQQLTAIQEQSNSLFIEYKGQQIELSTIVKTVWEEVKQSYKDGQKTISEEIKKLSPTLEDSIKESLNKLKGYFSFVGDIYVEYLKKVAPNFNNILDKAKEVQKAQTDLAASKKQDFPALEGTQGDANVKNAAITKAAMNAMYKDITRESALATQKMKADLKDLDFAYNENIISIADYFEKKKRLQLDDITNQEANLRKEQGIALSNKDQPKADELTDKIRSLEEQKSTIESDIFNNRYKALENYNDLLRETEATYLDFIGKTGEAAQLQFTKSHEKNISKLMAEYASGDQNAGIALEQTRITEAYTVFEGKLKGLSLERTKVNDDYNASLQKTNILFNTGAIGQLQSMVQIKSANEERIVQLEKIISTEKEAIDALAGQGIPEDKRTEKFRKYQLELENLKAESNTVGQYIQTTLGKAFDQPLANLVDGSMNAKQAFRSFAISVQQDIANIVAQELRSILLKQLFSAGSSILGALGGGVSTAAGNSSSLSSFDLNKSFNWGNTVASANGNIFSGKGISSHSSTIVDKPTIFPFAQGVGLMGEAGAEAIVPLARDRNGKMGVKQINGSSTGGINIGNMNITVQQQPNATPEDQSKQIGMAVKQQLTTLIQQQMVVGQRSGGILNPTQMAASF
jgi:tape measure domain-containing protein